MNALNNLAKETLHGVQGMRSQGSPLFHGAIGIWDELVLIACIVFVAVAVFAFYFSALRKSKEDQ